MRARRTKWASPSATTDSDGGAVQYAYDAFGRLASATDAAGHAEAFARNELGVVTNETQTVFDELFWTNRTAVLDRPLDAFGRPAGLSLKIDGDFAQSICYDYGVDGHLSGMVLTNAQGRSVSVGYDWEQGRFVGCTVFDSSGAPIFERTVSRAPRRPALVTACSSGGIGTSADTRSFSYAYDAVGRPVERGADAFAYNARGEVTNATIDSAAWSYAYDHIGNRTTASDSAGTTAYTANNVNQYTAVGADAPEYDLDGNLAAFGDRTNAWNAAGRLVSTTWTETNGLQRLRSEYDHRGRRVRRVLETSADAGATWTVIDNRTFAYDDWNLIYERSERPNEGAAELAFFWGPDLSGSLQGAGGIGGLVAISIGGDFYFPGYDNNGNVVGYWNEDGALVAEYSYDAFGKTISSSGSMESVFPHRFSTKYYDAETDLYYYGYRYYASSLGRWISRDPAEERGGLSLYRLERNDPLFSIDALGLEGIVFLKADSEETRMSHPTHAPISVVDDIPDFKVEESKMSDNGRFFYCYDGFNIDVSFDDKNQICEIRFRLGINIRKDIANKTVHEPKDIIRYKKHVAENGHLKKALSHNSIYPATLAHEKGHARAFWEVLKPRIESELASYFTTPRIVYTTDAQKNEVKKDVAKKVDQLYHLQDHLEKSAQYANEGTIGFYENPFVYQSLGAADVGGERSYDGRVWIVKPQHFDYSWEKQ